MDPMLTPNPMFTQATTFWMRLWQAQMEQSLKYLGAWAQAIPHETAAELSRDAEALKR